MLKGSTRYYQLLHSFVSAEKIFKRMLEASNPEEVNPERTIQDGIEYPKQKPEELYYPKDTEIAQKHLKSKNKKSEEYHAKIAIEKTSVHKRGEIYRDEIKDCENKKLARMVFSK